MPIIEVNSLSYNYAGSQSPALRKISLKIEKGEFLLLTGATGSGKTTLCRCLTGLIPHHYAGGKVEGSVKIGGLETSQHMASEIALRVGYVFQNPENQLFALTVEKNVSFGLENVGLAPAQIRQRVDWALMSVGMLDLRKRAPYDLSAGQQQRAAIASALALRPDILIMDEPTAHLDPRTAKGIITVARELNTELKMTVILVEHRLDLAAPHASRLAIMKEGRLVRDGPPQSILFEPEIEKLAIALPKTVVVFKALGRPRSRFERIPLDPAEAGRKLRYLAR